MNRRRTSVEEGGKEGYWEKSSCNGSSGLVDRPSHCCSLYIVSAQCEGPTQWWSWLSRKCTSNSSVESSSPSQLGVQFTLRSRSSESSLRIVVVLWRFRCFLVSSYSSITSSVPLPRTLFHLRRGKTHFCKWSFGHFNCSYRLAWAAH